MCLLLLHHQALLVLSSSPPPTPPQPPSPGAKHHFHANCCRRGNHTKKEVITSVAGGWWTMKGRPLPLPSALHQRTSGFLAVCYRCRTAARVCWDRRWVCWGGGWWGVISFRPPDTKVSLKCCRVLETEEAVLVAWPQTKRLGCLSASRTPCCSDLDAWYTGVSHTTTKQLWNKCFIWSVWGEHQQHFWFCIFEFINQLTFDCWNFDLHTFVNDFFHFNKFVLSLLSLNLNKLLLYF